MIEFINFLKIFKRNPIDVFFELLNTEEYKYTYLLVAIFGFILGLNSILNKILISNTDSSMATWIAIIIKIMIFTFIVIYIWSWIIKFINSALQGYSGQKSIFAVISYSLLPLIFSSIFISIFKIILFALPGLGIYTYIIMHFFYCVYFMFFIVTIIYLVIGNSISNNFSIAKSIIATSIIPILYIGVEIMKRLK
jgi:hypothetical protein